MRTLQVLVVMFVAAVPVLHAEIVDQILATVDTEAILLSEVMMEIAPGLAELQASSADQASFGRAADKLIREALDQAIETKILLREAVRTGIEFDEERVDERLQEMRKRYDSPEQFNKELEASGETLGDLRVRIRKQTLARAMAVRKQNEFEKEVVVSESDVAQYFEDHEKEFSRPERVRVSQVYLPASNDANERATVKARMEEILSELKQGGDFAAVAKAYSKEPSAEQGGVIGWVVRGDLVQVLEEAAFTLPVGGISEVLESPGGFHILKVEERQDAGQATLEDVRKDIEPKLRAQVAAERYKKWVQELRKESRVRVFY
ncbi:MAG TPA: peptidylprolyl isomerase [Candidatus Hydrogenedentes bacterium]|nr:peptidylprolyl isomerase [Candidatus Hydrogenedentota bacterium]HQE81796.1 peptidylprolyl isomerase [Candidatus Hydrogenedentota bacterium]HQH54060.1 peptidylprolyl isomerase [Candidatus Hydrogenedentota bacterium]HQM51210.1 peptidylprolyl isomerase [Candidatus Hydrogenedentota bacterium]